MTNTVFFDLDGTLTDPKVGITVSIQYAMERLGADVPESDELTWCIGPPLLESLAALVGADQSEEALRLYRERFSVSGLYENTVYPGISEVLSQLSKSGLQLCVASSKPRIYVGEILEHFELSGYFEKIFGSELDGTRGDKSELLRFALAESRANSSTSMMVGDRKHDVIGATNNDMHAIGVLYGYGSEDELKQAGARHLVDTPQDLISLLL
jgi:phosphoglycolate phosphatase